MTTFELL